MIDMYNCQASIGAVEPEPPALHIVYSPWSRQTGKNYEKKSWWKVFIVYYVKIANFGEKKYIVKHFLNKKTWFKIMEDHTKKNLLTNGDRHIKGVQYFQQLFV